MRRRQQGLGFFETGDTCVQRKDARAPANKQVIQNLKDKVLKAERDLKSALSNAEAAVADADRLAQQLEDPSALYSISKQALSARQALLDGLNKVERIKGDMAAQDASFTAGSVWCAYTPHPAHTRFIGEMKAMATEATAAAIAAFSRADLSGIKLAMTRAMSEAERQRDILAAVQARADEVERVRVEQSELDRLRFEAEQERLRRQEERELAREEAARQREEAARAREEAMEAQYVARQRAAEQEERQFAAEERAEIQTAEARKVEAELQRFELEQAAEQRRFQLEQEAVLRAEERELRAEEREGELRRLMLIQELAAKGIPLPPGLPGAPAPGMPGAFPGALPGPPGFAPLFGPPGFAPPFGAPFGPPGFAPPFGAPFGPPGLAPPWGAPAGYPGVVAPGGFATGPQVPMPGAPVAPAGPPQMQPFGAPPVYDQIGPAGVPFAAPPPVGMAWATFDPGAELFGMNGMGALAPAPNLRGAQIEAGYTVFGPGLTDESANVFLKRSDGSDVFPRGLTLGAIRNMGGVMDRNKLVFTAPPEDTTTEREVGATLRELIRSAAKSYEAYAGRDRPRLRYPQGPAFLPSRKKKVPTWLWVGGAVAVGGAALLVLTAEKEK